MGIVNALFPITRGHYWYLTAYFGLYLMIPFLNSAIKHLSQKVYTVSLIAMFVVINILPKFLGHDAYNLKDGYSMIWLCMLYLLGAYIKKYDIAYKVKKVWAWILFLASVSVTFLSKFILDFTTSIILGEIKFSQLLISYISPTKVLAGIGLFLACANISFNAKFEKAIGILSPATLGVYIIHSNEFVWNSLITSFSKSFSNYNPVVMVALIITSAVIIYLSCSAIDLIRIKLFKIIKINTLCNKIEICVYKKLNKFYHKLTLHKTDKNI